MRCRRFPVTIGGGVAGRIAYWSDGTTLTSSAGLTFDGTDLTVTYDINCDDVNGDTANFNYIPKVGNFSDTTIGITSLRGLFAYRHLATSLLVVS